jgi:SAM-dependent methyltransferase
MSHEAALAACPETLRGPLRACLAGEAPPNLALMQLLAEASDEDEASRTLAALRDALQRAGDLEAAENLSVMLRLWADTPDAFALVKSVLSGLQHDRPFDSPDEALGYIQAAFDRAVAISPEASVALYSIGRADVLESATTGIVDAIRRFGLLAPDTRVLDIGCGIGRLEQALAPHVADILGVDLSPAMVAEARRRCADLANVRFAVASGRGFPDLADESFDLVIAVDTFPYIVQAGPGLVRTHVAEAARLLRPGGALLILNFSYRGDPAADAAEMASLAAEAGLALERSGTRDCAAWDGITFLLRKP